MAEARTDRNLLTGILALQMDFISREQLLEAMNAWMLRKSTSLAELLVEQKALTPDTRDLLEALVDKHLALHNGDPQQSLAALSSIGTVRDNLTQLGDPDIEASLNHVSAAWPARDDDTPTFPAGAGSSTSAGRRFRILRPHAEGGLGRILVARDEELHREVALKEMLSRHAHDTESRARFLMEAEITGGLEHPGVVPIYGLGQYADGRPFYAMRFIRGDSLKEAIERFHRDDARSVEPPQQPADARQPADTAPPPEQADKPSRPRAFDSVEFRKLLGRFIDVCNAVEYAHSRGVLHRDLKPGNIMLGKYGETLVVDWGLAKPLGRREGSTNEGETTLRPESGSGSHPTQFGSAVGTPAYMSPEQAAGELDAMGPASDVYSLGATLYCLLAGRSPFSGPSAGEVLRRVQKGDYEPVHSVRPDVPKPLQAICQRAMARSPRHRYASPSALAEDIERWLADEPVSAFQEPLPMRARRWLRRHPKTIAALAATVLVGLSSMIGIAAVVSAKNQQLELANYNLGQSNEAERQAKEDALAAQRAAEEARIAAEKASQLEVAAKEAAVAAEQEAKRQRDEAERNFALAQELFEQSDGYYALTKGLVANESGMLPLRRELVDKTLALNRRRVAELAERGDSDPELADLYLRMAEMAGTVESMTDTATFYERAIDVLEKLSDADPQEVEYRRNLAKAYSNLGMAYHTLGRAQESSKAISHGDDLWATLSDERYRYAISLTAKGVSMQSAGEMVAAQATYEQALGILEQLVQDAPENDDARSALAMCQAVLASLFQATGDLESAENLYLAAEAACAELAAKGTDSELRSTALGMSSAALAEFYRQTGRPEEAEAAYQRARDAFQSQVDRDPGALKSKTGLAGAYLGMGNLYQDDPSRLGDAEDCYLRARDLMTELVEQEPDLPASRSALANVHTSLGMLYRNTGRPLQAEKEFRAAQQIRAALTEVQPAVVQHRRDLAQSWENLARAHMDLKRTAEAEQALQKSLETWQALVDDDGTSPENHNGLAAEHAMLGWFHLTMNRLDASHDEYGQALEIREELATKYPDVPLYQTDLAEACRFMGEIWKIQGDLDKATGFYQRSAQIHEHLAERFTDSVEARVSLAQAYGGLGTFFHSINRLAEAQTAYSKAYDVQKALADSNPDQPQYRRELSVLCNNLGQVYILSRQPQQGEEMHQRALSIRQQLARDYPKVIEYQTDLILSHHNLGQFYQSMLQFPKAEAAYATALEYLKRLCTNYPEVAYYRYVLIESHLTLARFYSGQGQSVPAESNFRQAVETAQALVDEQPDVADYRRSLGNTLNQHATFLTNIGRFADAAESLQTALAVQEKLAADVPEVSFYRDDMAITHMNVGSLHMMQREFELARSEYLQAIDIARTLIDAEPNNEALQVRLAAAYQALVRISYEIGDLETARQTAVRALELAENIAAARPDIFAYRKEVATCQRQIGVLYMMLDRADEADAAYRKALDILQPLAAAFPNDPTYGNELADAYVNVGARLQYLESPRDAVDWFDRALSILDSESFRELPQLNSTRVLVLSSRALALTELERYDDAMADWEKALQTGTLYDRDELVVGRSATLAYRGNYRRALSEAEARIKESNPAPQTIYNMGCLYSIAVGAVQKDESLDDSQRKELVEQYASRAMEYLIQAKAGGVYRVPVVRNRVATHRDLAPIAQRPEFQAFLQDIESEAEEEGTGKSTDNETDGAKGSGADEAAAGDSSGTTANPASVLRD